MTQQLTGSISTLEFEGEKKHLTPFEPAVTEAIAEVFNAFGENVKQALYRKLENNYGVAREQIPIMIDEFVDALESIFGNSAKLVELKIMKRIQRKNRGFSYKSKNNEILFTEYLAELRSYLDFQMFR
jgi:hypothetical protein